MGDLQCAVTVLLARPCDAGQAGELGLSLLRRRVAAVYWSGPASCRDSATVVARELGLQAHPAGSGDEGRADGRNGTVLQRIREVLGDIADLHRGETVVLVTQGATITAAVTGLLSRVPPDVPAGAVVPRGEVVEVAGDSDGWVLVRWPAGTSAQR